MLRPLILATALAACGTDAQNVYTEQHDATNNSNVGGTPEPTGLTLGATGSIVIDGVIDNTHFDTESLDYDAYTFTVSAEAIGTLTIGPADAGTSVALLRATIIDSTSFGIGHAKFGTPGQIDLPPGTYKLEVEAQNPTEIAASHPYSVEIAAAP